MNEKLFTNTIHLADNALILAQRNAEWTGHGPVLEQDIAITNIALDLLGQARNFYQYATEMYNRFSASEKEAVDVFIPIAWKSFGRELQEDDLAMLREERQYLNLLLMELPRGDWAQTVLRQFFFSAYQQLLYRQMVQSPDAQLRAIAEKSLKEVDYHVRWSSEWVIRLGDGTDESKQRMEAALAEQWSYAGEMFEPADYESINPASFKAEWMIKVQAVFEEAGLTMPESSWMQTGGKKGIHTEHMGYLLTDLQYLQRAYPNSVW